MAPGRKLPVIFSVESDKPAIIRASNSRKRKIGRWYKVQKPADCSMKRLRHHRSKKEKIRFI
jgi:hypothetical protein